MSVIIINPNSTASMTEAMVTQAQKAAPELTFEGWTSTKGPASIQGREDGAAATQPLLELVSRAVEAKAQGIIIGCFDDTALTEAATLAPCPVIGLGQASFHHAALRNWRFSVVTTLAVSIPILEENIAQQGLDGCLSRVRASEVPVLALDADPANAGRTILAEVQKAQGEDQIDAVVLGCAGMVHVAEDIQRKVNVTVLDPVVCAARALRFVG